MSIKVVHFDHLYPTHLVWFLKKNLSIHIPIHGHANPHASTDAIIGKN